MYLLVRVIMAPVETAQRNGLVAESDDVSAIMNPKPETLDDGTQTVRVMR